MAMRRALLERIGPMDEAFGPGSYIGSGADSDLMFRAYLAGATLEYVPDMIVFHYHGRKSPESGRQLMRRYTIGNGALFARYLFRHPDLCRVFYGDLRDAARGIINGKNTQTPMTPVFQQRPSRLCRAGGDQVYFDAPKALRGKVSRYSAQCALIRSGNMLTGLYHFAGCSSFASQILRELQCQPLRDRGVDINRLLLRHPVAGLHNHLGQVSAVPPHRLG